MFIRSSDDLWNMKNIKTLKFLEFFLLISNLWSEIFQKVTYYHILYYMYKGVGVVTFFIYLAINEKQLWIVQDIKLCHMDFCITICDECGTAYLHNFFSNQNRWFVKILWNIDRTKFVQSVYWILPSKNFLELKIKRLHSYQSPVL